MLLRNSIHSRKISYNYHDSSTSLLEAVFARGDRKLCDVLECAVENGLHFDGWDECFNFEKWMEIFDKLNIDPAFYANRHRDFSEILPWDHIDYGVSKKFLINECKKAYNAETTANCREKCAGCGASKWGKGVCFENCKNLVQKI